MENNPVSPQKNACIVYPDAQPDLNNETYRGSFQQLLRHNVGKYVTVEFVISPCEIRPLSGIVESVTGRYVVLENPRSHTRVVGDAWSIKTVTFPYCE